MTMIVYPPTLSIKWLRRMYLTNQVTPYEVIVEILNRVNRDVAMNIWITKPDIKVIKPYLDTLSSLDPDSLPLWGIPFALKDNIDILGMPTTAGCPAYEYIPDQHAIVVERLIAAGAIPLGKTNMDQFATGLVGTRTPYGETSNAFREELISGGSSSGSAVAVARGNAAFALGTDTAGSGRVPAALNRLIGYKPSLGAWPIQGVVPACASLDCISVFTNDIEDTLEVDRITRGTHEKDPWSRNIPMNPPKLPAKVCLPKQGLDFFGPYSDEYSQAWTDTVIYMEKLGIPIEYIDVTPFLEASTILYDGAWVAERWASLGQFVESHDGEVMSVTEQILRLGNDSAYSATSLFQAIHGLQSYKHETKRLLEDAVLVLPTTGGTWTRDEVGLEPIDTNRRLGLYTNHCNLLDLCAIAVPSRDAAINTPFGITFFSLAKNEDLIIGSANCYLDSLAGLELNNIEQSRKMILIAVCGLHMRGFPLEKQMYESGARFIREAKTAAKYQFVKLPTTPSKPGLIKKVNGGTSILLELWEMPTDTFGSFAASIPAPLGIGKVELDDGVEVSGFICEAYAEHDAEDISGLGDWRQVAVSKG